jgi:hypothetical protein
MTFDDSLVRMETSPLIGPYANYLIWLVPAIELLITVFLFISATRILGLYASMILLFLFTAYILWVLNFSPRVPCSCGGVIQTLSWKGHIILNTAFLILTVTGIVFQHGIKKNALKDITR